MDMPSSDVADSVPRPEVALETLDLAKQGAGRWLVETASRSGYLVTNDGVGRITLTRRPRSASSRPVGEVWPSADLRGDGTALQVMSVGRTSVSDDGMLAFVAEVRVGFPVVWLLEPLAEDADVTTRVTTDVVAIARLDLVP